MPESGIICIAGDSSVTIQGGSFDNNAASRYGAIMIRDNATGTLVDVTIANNTATNPFLPLGGGVMVGGHATVRVANSRFLGNRCIGGLNAGGAGGCTKLLAGTLGA